jgi:hypothetical protein
MNFIAFAYGKHRNFIAACLPSCKRSPGSKCLYEYIIELVGEKEKKFAWDSETILFHTIFLDWPTRFFAFLDLLYRSVHWPSHLFDAVVHRWRWLLSTKWSLIAPSWLFEAYEEHTRQFYASDWCKQQQLQALRLHTFSLKYEST